MGHERNMQSPLIGRDDHSNNKYRRWGLLLFFLLAFLSFIYLAPTDRLSLKKVELSAKEQKYVPDIVESEIGVVASDDARCSEVGASILRMGGHAVDAAVATALCVGVVNPPESGIGGGAFMIVRSASTSEARAFDMRETAPAAAYKNMYDDNPGAQFEGPLSVGVPGELAGLHEAWKMYGRLPWRTLVQPSIEYARNGFEVFPYLSIYIEVFQNEILADRGKRQIFAPGGKILRKGDTCYNKKIAETLEAIAEQGAHVLYNGWVGEKLVEDVKEQGGIMTLKDLSNYKVNITHGLEVDVMGYKIHGMFPPSSGTVGVAMVANVLQNYGNSDELEGSLGLHRLTEAIKHMLAARMNLGDPAYDDVSEYISKMTSPSFAKEIWHKIYDNTTFPPEYYMSRWSQLQDHGTSHISVVDADRNAVALTASINDHFGGKTMCPITGILLNNQMGDFATPTQIRPDNLPPATSNFIEPGKRPLSSMTPLIILKDGQLAGVIGGSGGLNIIMAVIQIFLKHFVQGVDPLTAVQSPRIYPRLLPNDLYYENQTVINGKHIELLKEDKVFLEQRGHRMQEVGFPAVCNFVVHNLEGSTDIGRKNGRKSVGDIHFGTLTAVSDLRKDAKPAAA